MGKKLATWHPLALAFMAAGATMRLVALVLSWGKPVGPDSSEYLLLAKRYSFAHPFAASYREPLWRAIVKVATGPFGYSQNSFRCFTAGVSIATLPVLWLALRRLAERKGLGPRVPLIAFGILAFSQQLVRDAPRGLREDLCLLLFLGVAFPLLAGDRSRRAAALVAASVGLLAAIRFELGSLALIMVVLFALARRASALAPALALVLLVTLAGPWVLANKQRHGDLLYQSKVHSTFYWKLEQPKSVVARYRTPPGVDPKIALSWSQYYLDYLGPRESAKRIAQGYPRLLAKLTASQIVPRGAAMSALGANQNGRVWRAVMAAIAAALLLAAAFAATRIWRSDVARSAAALIVLSLAPYTVIAAFVELRVVMFAVPVFALLVAMAVEACVAARLRRPAEVLPASS